MLDLNKVALGELAAALEDHAYEHSWWLDPQTGEVVLWSDYFDEEEDEPDAEARGLRPIDPIPSREAYQDMQDFIERVRNPQARDLLERAIAGRGAFRRFKDTLFEFPELRDQWFRFRAARSRRRALNWLAVEGLISREAAEQAAAQHPDPTQEDEDVPAAVAVDLGILFGDRLQQVLLYGAWARNETPGEFDLELLVVLDDMHSPWEELHRMDEVLWRHTERSGLTVTALPVSRAELAKPTTPHLVRAAAEAVLVA